MKQQLRLTTIGALFCALITICLQMPAAKADPALEQQLQAIDISTPQYKAYESSDFEPAMGRYTYEVSWNGIPAAEATMDIGTDETNYRLSATARTYSPINLLYDLHYRADGWISAANLMPLRTSIDQHENSKDKKIEISFHPGGEIESIRSQTGKATDITRFTTSNGTLDPFSAAFLARGLDWKVGDTKYFDTFNGKLRYLITLTATGKEDVTALGRTRSCWVIVPTVRKLTSNEPQHKLREARIYLSDDSSREVVKVVSEVFIGAVTTKLIKFEPASTPEPIRMAQLRARAVIK